LAALSFSTRPRDCGSENLGLSPRNFTGRDKISLLARQKSGGQPDHLAMAINAGIEVAAITIAGCSISFDFLPVIST
jgi:hypothetical protein